VLGNLRMAVPPSSVVLLRSSELTWPTLLSCFNVNDMRKNAVLIVSDSAIYLWKIANHCGTSLAKIFNGVASQAKPDRAIYICICIYRYMNLHICLYLSMYDYRLEYIVIYIYIYMPHGHFSLGPRAQYIYIYICI